MSTDQTVAGIDEVGMGPIAGPIVFGLVLLDKGTELPAVRDSKKLSEKQKYEAAVQVAERARYHFIYKATAAAIDHHGVGKIWTEAVDVLVEVASVQCKGVKIIIDGSAKALTTNYPVEFMVKADEKIPAVSAASVLAKCEQMEIMNHLHDLYPEYGFNVNRGYGTAAHIDALREFGAVRGLHRQKYAHTLAKNQGFKLRWRDS